MIALTGSIETGRWVARAAAETLKRTHLELGGKAPVLVFNDADLETAVATIAGTGFYNAGQDATAATRVLAQEDVYGEVLTGLADRAGGYTLGDPLDPQTTLGPLNSSGHREHVEGFLARRPGHAELVAGGRRPPLRGAFLEPTVIGGLRQGDELIQREIFGPVITVQPFGDEDEAIDLANNTPYGLAASVWTYGRQAGAAGRERAALRLRVDQRPRPARLRDAARRRQAVRPRLGPLAVRARGLHGPQARDGEHRVSRASRRRRRCGGCA